MMVMSDGGVRWLIFNQKATGNTMQPSNTPFQPFQQYLYMAEVYNNLPNSSFTKRYKKINPVRK